MTGKLEGRIAVITGGSAGIGLGTARRFAEEGARVFITGRREAELDRAVTDIGRNATAIRADAAKLADIDHIYDVVKREAGQIDVLFANAGIYEPSPLGEITEDHFDKIFGINVRGLLFTVQKALPLLSAGSSVILTGSVVSMKGFPAYSVYNATKAAVRSFARTWTVDLKGRGIRINVLSPGPTETPSFTGGMSEDLKSSLAQQVPLARLGSADDIAKAALFLASDDSSFITGIELFVDGGMGQV